MPAEPDLSLAKLNTDIRVRVPLEIYKIALQNDGYRDSDGQLKYTVQQARLELTDGLADVGVIGRYADELIDEAKTLFLAGKNIPTPLPLVPEPVRLSEAGHLGVFDQKVHPRLME